MRKALTYILILVSLSAQAQIVNKFRDSTWFKSGVRFDSTVVFSKGAAPGKVWTSDVNGTGTWQTFTSSGVTQSALDDSIAAVRDIRKVDTIYKNAGSDSVVFLINGVRYSILDKDNNTSTFSFTKNAAKDSIIAVHDGTRSAVKDSIADISNLATVTNLADTASTLRSIRKVDTLYRSSDSLVYTINGLRHSIKDSTGGGGASLSSITAATTSSTINNGLNPIEWQWNSLTSGVGLKLSSNSTAGLTGNTLFEVNNSGTLVNTSQNTYAMKVVNSKISSPSVNYGLDVNVSGGSQTFGINVAVSGGNSTGINLVAGMTTGIQLNNNKALFSTGGHAIQYDGTTFNFNSVGTRTYFTATGTSNYWCFNSGASSNFLTINRIANGSYGIVFNGDYVGGNYRGELTSANVIKASGGTMTFCANTSNSGGFAAFTPTDIMSITTTGVGIGTTTPVASAALEISSTTKGFLQSRHTTIQRDAVSSPATGLQIYNTTLNANNTYNGVNWTGDVIIDAGATLTLKHGVDYFFSGTTSTWTLPAINSAIAGRQNAITIKNRGTGNLTINTNAAANVLFTTALTNTIILAVGDSVTIMPDGTYFNVE